MKTSFLVAATVMVLVLSGCAASTGGSEVGHRLGGPVTTTDEHVLRSEANRALVEQVQEGWVGPDAPNEQWIMTEATLICKRANGGLEPRAHVEGTHAAENGALLVEAALQHACSAQARTS